MSTVLRKILKAVQRMSYMSTNEKSSKTDFQDLPWTQVEGMMGCPEFAVPGLCGTAVRPLRAGDQWWGRGCLPL